MPLSDEETFRLFSKHPLFKGLQEDELRPLFSLSKEKIIPKGEYLIREGERSNELFLVIHGALQVLKMDSEIQQSHVIDQVLPGEVVGEVSLLDHGAREASIQAVQDSVCRSIAFDDLQAMIGVQKERMHIFFHLAEKISRKLRHTNELAIDALRKTVAEYKIRSKMGELLLTLIAILSVLLYTLPVLRFLLRTVSNSTYVTLPMTFGFGILLIAVMRSFELSWKEMGITTKNLRRSLFEGLFYSLLPLAFIVLLKIFFINYVSPFQGRSLFEPYMMFLNPEHRTVGYWLLTNVAYCLVIVPIQELLVRGGIQQVLLKLLNNKHRVGLSILVSNLIFSSSHVFFSVQIGLIVFLLGLFLGWLYSRTQNLAGPILAHILIGLTTISLLGLMSILSDTPF